MTLQTGARYANWQLVLDPHLVEPDPTRRTRPERLLAGTWPMRSRLSAPDTAAGRELEPDRHALPWFTHDALIHYLSPRGLEQYSGGAWGTRDVSQGPVGLLLALGAHAELRSCCC